MIIDRPICPDGQLALTGTSTSPCLAASRPFILAATILASAMGFIDGSVVTIALPSIERDLSAPFETIQWVVNGYTLTLGGKHEWSHHNPYSLERPFSGSGTAQMSVEDFLSGEYSQSCKDEFNKFINARRPGWFNT